MKMRTRGVLLTRWALAVGGGLCALWLAGCNIVGPAVLLANGPEKVPRAFALPKDRSVVVLVDVDSVARVRPAVRAALADQVGRDLLAHGGVKTVIDPRSAQSMASLDRFTSQMPVSEIGRAVGADLVVHVLIESFTLTPDGQSYAPTTALRVKVIDAANQERLFPEEREGQPVVITPKTTTRVLPDRGSEWNNSELDFGRYAGTAVAQMFYEHEKTGSHLLGR